MREKFIYFKVFNKYLNLFIFFLYIYSSIYNHGINISLIVLISIFILDIDANLYIGVFMRNKYRIFFSSNLYLSSQFVDYARAYDRWAWFILNFIECIMLSLDLHVSLRIDHSRKKKCIILSFTYFRITIICMKKIIATDIIFIYKIII